MPHSGDHLSPPATPDPLDHLDLTSDAHALRSQVEGLLRKELDRHTRAEHLYVAVIGVLLDALADDAQVEDPTRLQVRRIQARLQPPLSEADLRSLNYFVQRWERRLRQLTAAEGSVLRRTLGLYAEVVDTAPPRAIDAPAPAQGAASADAVRRLEEENRRLNQALVRARRLSLTDDLTGLHNRRAFWADLEEEIGRVNRYHYPLSLVLLDLDAFASFDASHGHAAGERVLCVYAELLTSSFRHYDEVARYEGGRFAVLLPNTELEGCLCALEHLRVRVQETRGEGNDVRLPLPGFSAGVTGFRPGDDALGVVARAEAALKRARAAGGNRVELGEGDVRRGGVAAPCPEADGRERDLASSLAHELKQPLSAVTNYARGGLQRLAAGAAPADLAQALEAIDEQARRAAHMVEHVRLLATGREPAKRPLDVNVAVRDVLRFLDELIATHAVRLELHLASRLPPVLGSPIRIEQAVQNVVRNAIEAMADDPDSPMHLVIGTSLGDGKVEVRVCDSGPGLAPSVREQLFRPFFTTKPQGTGIGLALSRSIVEAHGGCIRTAAHAPRGTCFHLAFPAIRDRRDPD